MIGYSNATQFDPNVTEGIFMLSTLVPAIGFLILGVALFSFYPLNKKRVEENARILSVRKNR